MEKEKIGIATYYNIYNYGSVLQAYALSSKINDLGYEAQILDYTDEKQNCFKQIKKRTYINRIVTSLKSPKLLYETIMIKIKGEKFVSDIPEKQKKYFDDFMYKYLNLSTIDILNNKDYFKGYICGSDQVWQISSPGLHEFYYLRFTEKNKRIAYAPSFGSLTIPWFNRKRLKKYLSEFSSISVREDSGVRIIEELIDVNAPQVLDPVLLVEPNLWNSFMECYSQNEKYIIGYFLGDVSEYLDIIEKIENEYGVKMILIDSGKVQKFDRERKMVDPIEFVALISKAKYVITDSLHGTEFSIVFKKQFIVLERNYITISEQNTRLKSLLRLFDLEDRYINREVKSKEYLNKINYKNIEEILLKERETSNLYLQNALIKLNTK